MNISNIQAKFTEHKIDALLLFTPQNIRYAAGFPVDDGAVLITRGHSWLFTDSRYIEAARAGVQGAEAVQFTREKPLADCLKDALTSCGAKAVGAEDDGLSHRQWRTYEEKLGMPLTCAGDILKSLRAVKQPYEVEAITAAQRIAENALDEVLGLIRPGITEREIAAELTYRMLLHGGEGNAFDPIAITGKKTSMPHGVPGDAAVQAGDFVTMDFGCITDGYRSDMTRTVAVGFATEEMRKVYRTVLEAQEAGIDAAKAGVTGAAVHAAAAEVIAGAGYGEYFGHGFGHSVGLDIHEAPNASPLNTQPLPAGAVVTAEPGIYLPGKFGVRIEDMLHITETGSVNLTKAPKELLVL